MLEVQLEHQLDPISFGGDQALPQRTPLLQKLRWSWLSLLGLGAVLPSGANP